MNTIITFSGFNYRLMDDFANQVAASNQDKKIFALTIQNLIQYYKDHKEIVNTENIDMNIFLFMIERLSGNNYLKTNSVWTHYLEIVFEHILSNNEDVIILLPKVLFENEFKLVEKISNKFNTRLFKYMVFCDYDLERQQWPLYGLSIDNQVEADIIQHDFHKKSNISFLDWTSSNFKYTGHLDICKNNLKKIVVEFNNLKLF